MPATNTALAAAALQDQWRRTLALGSVVPLGRPRNLPPLENRLKQPRKKHVKSMIDTGLRKPTKPPHANLLEPELPKERVLDDKPPNLTLAQKLGLSDAPAAQLTEAEWQKAKERSNNRDDSKQPCVICKEDFGFEQQVLLSCTHVFHRACLEAFERFTGHKSCPLCRKKQYQTRLIHEGAKHHHTNCAIKIQAAWRGYVVRCWYRKLRETVPPKDPKLRKKYYEQKLQSITDRMIASVECDVNAFLTAIDLSVQQSRNVYEQLDSALLPLTEQQWQHVYTKAVERGNTDCPICLTSLDESGQLTAREQKKTTSLATTKPVLKKQLQRPIRPTSWNNRKGKPSAQQTQPHGRNLDVLHEQFRRDQEKFFQEDAQCSFDSADGSDKSNSDGAAHKGRRSCYLLSCSHVFHATCLEAFEEYGACERRNTCPVCRTCYQKKAV